MPSNHTKVLELIRVANDAMAAVAKDASANEVFSAYFTMAATAIVAAKEMGVASADLKAIVYNLLLQCDDPKMRVM